MPRKRAQKALRGVDSAPMLYHQSTLESCLQPHGGRTLVSLHLDLLAGVLLIPMPRPNPRLLPPREAFSPWLDPVCVSRECCEDDVELALRLFWVWDAFGCRCQLEIPLGTDNPADGAREDGLVLSGSGRGGVSYDPGSAFPGLRGGEEGGILAAARG